MKTATERFGLQIRAESFNLTNTPTLGDPISSLGDPDLGIAHTTLSAPRLMQFAIRLSF